MATDGDLWERALRRGLPRDGTLVVIRRDGASVITAARRVRTSPVALVPPAGLYRLRGGRFVGADDPSASFDATPFGPLPADAMALVHDVDPAGAHA